MSSKNKSNVCIGKSHFANDPQYPAFLVLFPFAVALNLQQTGSVQSAGAPTSQNKSGCRSLMWTTLRVLLPLGFSQTLSGLSLIVLAMSVSRSRLTYSLRHSNRSWQTMCGLVKCRHSPVRIYVVISLMAPLHTLLSCRCLRTQYSSAILSSIGRSGQAGAELCTELTIRWQKSHGVGSFDSENAIKQASMTIRNLGSIYLLVTQIFIYNIYISYFIFMTQKFTLQFHSRLDLQKFAYLFKEKLLVLNYLLIRYQCLLQLACETPEDLLCCIIITNKIVRQRKQQMYPSLKTATLEEKQSFLRSQIIDAGVDAEAFMIFMGIAKGEGQNINLENWTIADLKQVVQEFKQTVELELKREQTHSKIVGPEQIARSRSSMMVADRVMGSKISKKEKIFYERDDLWDYELKAREQTKKAHKFFDLKVDPEISIKGAEVKKQGGFLGFGAKSYIELTLASNLSSSLVARKSEDADWLRTMLVSKFPGSYIPPLDENPVFEPEDKAAVAKRAKQIIQFLNGIVHFDHLLNNKFTHMFLTETDPKAFDNFRSKNTMAHSIGTIKNLQCLQGSFPIQISQRMQDLIKNSSKYSTQVNQILKNISDNFFKLQNDYISITRHYANLSSDFGKLKQKYTTVSQKCAFYKSEENIQFDKRMAALLAHLKNTFTTLETHCKRQCYMIRDFNEENIKVMVKEWSEFDVLQKKYKGELDAYLSLKQSLSRKKQQFFLDTSKRQLEDREKNGETKQTTLAQKEEMYKLRFPNQSKLEQQRKTWIGYINHMYQKSFLLLLSSHQKQMEKKLAKTFSALGAMLTQRAGNYNGFDKFIEAEASKQDDHQK